MICPICNSSANVCSVEDVIEAGIHTTRTEGVSIGMFGDTSFQQMYFTSTSVSKLSAMLMPPVIPLSSPWYVILVLAGIVIFTFKIGVENFMDNPESGLLGVVWYLLLGGFLSFLPGLGYGSLVYVVLRFVYASERKTWKRNREILLSSGFCQQDGVVIDHDGKTYSPAGYVASVFARV